MRVEIIFYFEEGKRNASVFDILDPYEVPVYSKIVAMCDKSDLIFYSIKENRTVICEYLGLSDIRVKQIISSIVSKEILLKIGRSKYRLNTRYLRVNGIKLVNK